MKLEDRKDKPFGSEIEFQQVIVDLLRRMGKQDVQILQGNLELGKDIVFRTVGGLNEEVFCCCVVKNTPISGSAGANRGASNVLFQARQCLTEDIKLPDGRVVRPTFVYVITPFDITPAAITSIHGQLAGLSGQVSFWGREKVISLLQQYWPDFLDDEFASITRHIEAIERGQLDTYDATASLGRRLRLPSLFSHDKPPYQPQDLATSLFVLRVKGSIRKELSDSIGPRPQKLGKHFLDTKSSVIDSFVATYVEVQEHLNSDLFDDSFLNSIKNSADYLKTTLATEGFEEVGSADWSLQFREAESQFCKALDLFTNEISKLSTSLTAIDISDPITAIHSPEFQLASRISDVYESGALALEAVGERELVLPHGDFERLNSSLAIVAPAGTGKSAFCRTQAFVDSKSVDSKGLRKLPVYVPLHQLNGTPLSSIEDSFLPTLGKALISNGSEELVSSTRLYLDGFDEVSDQDSKSRILHLAERASTGAQMTVVLTSRDLALNPLKSPFPRFQLLNFEPDSVLSFVDKWLGSKPTLKKRFLKSIGSHPQILDLMKVPLMATLTILLFLDSGDLPPTKTRLYSNCIDMCLGDWDSIKGVYRRSGYDKEVIKAVLGQLASANHLRGSRSMDISVLRTAIGDVSNTGRINARKLFEQCVDNGLLMGSEDDFYFSHLSFQEFLCAQFYAAEPDGHLFREALIKFAKGSSWWQEVVSFRLGLSQNPHKLFNWIVDSLIAAENRLYR